MSLKTIIPSEAKCINGLIEKLSSKTFFIEKWKPVYVSVEQNKLVYYNSQQKVLKGILDFSRYEASMQVLSSFQFRLTFNLRGGYQKTFTFRVKKESDLKSWVLSIGLNLS